MNDLHVTGTTKTGTAWMISADRECGIIQFGRFALRARFTAGQRSIAISEAES